MFLGVPALVGLISNIVTGAVILCEAWDRYDQNQVNQAGIARRVEENRTLHQAILDHGFKINSEYVPVSTKKNNYSLRTSQ